VPQAPHALVTLADGSIHPWFVLTRRNRGAIDGRTPPTFETVVLGSSGGAVLLNDCNCDQAEHDEAGQIAERLKFGGELNKSSDETANAVDHKCGGEEREETVSGSTPELQEEERRNKRSHGHCAGQH
jgi:hypothetical protein